MLKRWFEFSSNGNGSARLGEHRNGSDDQALALMEPQEHTRRPGKSIPAGDANEGGVPSNDRADFEQIYRSAAVKPPQLPYGILKVAEMANSQHLAGLAPEARRCAVMMALETAGAKVEELLQDAVVRQRSLNDYEQIQQEKLRRFEEEKAEENRNLQTELERLTSQYMARVQGNLDEVAREQDNFRHWQRKKQQEAQRIAEAAAVCVPEGTSPQGTLAAVLERACAVRR